MIKSIFHICLFCAFGTLGIVISALGDTPAPIVHTVVIRNDGTQLLRNRATLKAILYTGVPDLGENGFEAQRKSIMKRGLAGPTALTPAILAEAQAWRTAVLAAIKNP